jgi:uncharacterized protein (DUF4415 family)
MTKHPEKPRHISREDWESVDTPEMTEAEFARAKPFKDAFPGQFEAWKRGRGRPKAEAPKVHIGFRIAADLAASIKDSGRGYNARVEKVLREALAEGKLQARARQAAPSPSRSPGQQRKAPAA